MKDGLFLGMYPLKTVFLGAIIATVILITAFKVVKSNITKKDMMCNVSIELNDKKINIKTKSAPRKSRSSNRGAIVWVGVGKFS